MGASLVSSLFSLGLGIYVALPATLSCAGVFVADYSPRLVVVLRSIVDMGKFVWATYPFLLSANVATALLRFLDSRLRDPCQHISRA